MTNIFDSNRFGTLTSEALSNFENKYSFNLPEDYKSFLIEHNGGQPEPSNNKNPETDVKWIYGIHPGEYWASIEYHIKTFEKRIPKDTLPIAGDSSGNLFLLSLQQSTFGEVWFWDHENEAENDATEYYDNITTSSHSFYDFVHSLYEWIDPDETMEEKIIRTNDIESLKELIKTGYDVNQKDLFNRTLLENASMCNKLTIAKLLYDNGAKPFNSLSLAVQNQKASPTRGYEEIVAFLTKIN